MRPRLSSNVAAVLGAFALLGACVGSDPTIGPSTPAPDGGSTSSSGGSTSSTSSSGGIVEAGVSLPGALDPTFGTGGVFEVDGTTYDGFSSFHAVALVDGTIVAAGEGQTKAHGFPDPLVVKVDGAGKAVTTFGAAGIATTSDLPTSLTALSIDGNGAIVTGGVRNDHASFFRTDANGGAPRENAYLVEDSVTSVESVLTGSGLRYFGGEDAQDFRLWKLKDGANTVESSFGGRLPALAPGNKYPARASKLRVDGKRIVAVAQSMKVELSALVVARFVTDTGNVDPTFAGGKGIFSYPLGGEATSTAIEKQGVGWVVAGSLKETTRNLVLIKIDQDGASLDPAFGKKGQATIDIDNLDDQVLDMAVDGQGRIYLVGYRRDATKYRGYLLRLTSTGSVDKDFGKGGLVELPFPFSQVAALALQSDGRIVVAGVRIDGETSRAFLARFLP